MTFECLIIYHRIFFFILERRDDIYAPFNLPSPLSSIFNSQDDALRIFLAFLGVYPYNFRGYPYHFNALLLQRTVGNTAVCAVCFREWEKPLLEEIRETGISSVTIRDFSTIGCPLRSVPHHISGSHPPVI